MIADCAIDPEVFAQWRHFQSLLEDFGVGKGRLISKFPKSWVRSVAQNAEKYVKEGVNSEMQTKRIIERLSQPKFKRKLKAPSGRDYDQSVTWSESACAANPPFDLVILQNSTAASHAVCADDLLKDEFPFLRPTQVHIKRTKEQLMQVAEVLLSTCKEFIIVDPNFRIDEPRFCEPLIYLFELLEKHQITPSRLEVHTKQKRSSGDEFRKGPQESQWQHNIQPHLPSSWTLKVVYWDALPGGGKPHARFLLTEQGGLYYDHGLDTGDGETLVTLLEDEIWENLSNTYDTENLPNSITSGDFIIELKG